MPIYALGDRTPRIDSSAFVHPDAVIIGDVTIGAESSIWPSTVLRGDTTAIVIGARTSVQDGAVVHVSTEGGTEIGDDCLIGHLAYLEGCIIESGAQVSVGAMVLHHVRVCSGATVGANAVVRDGTIVPERALAVGVPAVIKEGRSRPEDIARGVAGYVAFAQRYPSLLRRID
jgi:carbonic anhydrase/acetyltransferase-like protein (isoleucine patch superfamily)